MKSERRHELKTNELADWLVHLPAFWHKHARTIIYVLIVAILVGVSAYFSVYRKAKKSSELRTDATLLIDQLNYNKQQSLQGQQSGLGVSNMFILTANSLKAISAQITDDNLSAMALIKQGQALRTELHYASGMEDKQAIEVQIAQARKCYQQALAKPISNATLIAMAKFGLGLCEEELGNFDGARQIYNEIVSNPEFAYTVFVPQAEERLATMEAYKEAVVFAKAPPKPKIESGQEPIGKMEFPWKPGMHIQQAEVNSPAETSAGDN